MLQRDDFSQWFARGRERGGFGTRAAAPSGDCDRLLRSSELTGDRSYMGFNSGARAFTARIFRFAAILGLAGTLGSAVHPPTVPVTSYPASQFDGELSVLTYDVKGLPWPIASGRVDALSQISHRLSELEKLGRQPEVVILQEAFIDDAKAIGAVAGYRFFAEGPGAPQQSGITATVKDARFAKNGSWWKGEDIGQWTGSGLQILSDFSITAVHTAPFPATACAGYDCLAKKGVMLAHSHVEPLKTTV